METSKEEMIVLLRELQDLQMWLLDSLQEISLNINLCVFENGVKIDCYTCLFSDIKGTSESIFLSYSTYYEENRAQLNYFVKYVKKLAKYGCKKSKSNQTPT